MTSNKHTQELTDEQISVIARESGIYRTMVPDGRTCERLVVKFARAILAASQAAPVAAEVPQGGDAGTNDELQLMRGHASLIVTNICQHSRNKHTMTGWLDDACTSAEILHQWIEKKAYLAQRAGSVEPAAANDALITALKDIAESCNCCGDRHDLAQIAQDALDAHAPEVERDANLVQAAQSAIGVLEAYATQSCTARICAEDLKAALAAMFSPAHTDKGEGK